MVTISELTRFSQSFGKAYGKRFEKLTARTGLTMREVHVLLFLANHPGQDTARDVVELRGLSKSQVSQAVEGLTRRGLLERRPDGSDRRVVRLTITEAGEPLAREAQSVQLACGRALLAGLTEEEEACFWRLLGKVLEQADRMIKEAAE